MSTRDRSVPRAAALENSAAHSLALITERVVGQIAEAVDAHADANRAEARLWASLAELMWLARANPQLYLRSAGIAQPDVIALAEDAAAFDVGLRLHLSANQVRNLAHRAQSLHDQLPRLHAAFSAGGTTATHATVALELVAGWCDAAAVRLFDAQLSEVATELTVPAFRARALRIKEKLFAEPAEVRHARAFAERRFWIEPVEHGMAWIHALVAAPDAIRIASRLNATARTEQKTSRVGSAAWRSRDQIRADLAVGWLAGDGTATAAKVRPILLVPLLSLLGEGDEPIELRGYGSIDRVTAARLFDQAPSFRRVATDPFNGEKLVYDRGRYRPTQAQRDWIAMRFEQCIDPSCSRPVGDTDVDHLEEWVRDNGASNADNLFPLCERSNRRKNLSRFAYKRLPNGDVAILTPTGLNVTTEPAPF